MSTRTSRRPKRIIIGAVAGVAAVLGVAAPANAAVGTYVVEVNIPGNDTRSIQIYYVDANSVLKKSDCFPANSDVAHTFNFNVSGQLGRGGNVVSWPDAACSWKFGANNTADFTAPNQAGATVKVTV